MTKWTMWRNIGLATGVAAGFSLVEVLVAIGLLTVTGLSAVRLLVFAVDATAAARRQSTSTVLAASKLEQLRSLEWAYEPTADGRAGSRVGDLSTDLSLDPPGSGGPGLGLSPDASLQQSIPPYVDYLDAAGRWVGQGASPPEGTVFVRRWSVRPLADSPDVLRLRVSVVPLSRESRRRGVGAHPLRDETRLDTLRARRTR